MTIAQCKAERRKFRTDVRYRPKRGNRAGTWANRSQRRAAAKMRKRVQMGGAFGSIGFGGTGKKKGTPSAG